METRRNRPARHQEEGGKAMSEKREKTLPSYTHCLVGLRRTIAKLRVCGFVRDKRVKQLFYDFANDIEVDLENLERIRNEDRISSRNALKSRDDANMALRGKEHIASLIDGAFEIVELYETKSPAQEKWKREWLEKALNFGACSDWHPEYKGPNLKEGRS
jgi:hypothetical protein